jgi:peptide/nickel transport system substrate-binding protein
VKRRPLALLIAWCLLDITAVVSPDALLRGQAAVEELLTTTSEAGRHGGQLTIPQRSEPRTLNPVMTVDSPSREILRQTIGDLIHINRETHRTEAALARSWTVSPDGRRFIVTLRRGIRFSDGHPFGADDVIFSFQVYQDEKVGSPQRETLRVGGQPIAVRKIDQHTVQFDLAEGRAGADRLFDSVAMLPKHLLEKIYAEGGLSNAWGLTQAPAQIAGLGPFRLKEYVAGQRVVLERNPYYWKTDRLGKRLPYLDQLIFLSVANEDAQVLRFRAGEADVIARIGAENFEALARDQSSRGYVMRDLGASLEYNFLFFNLNDLAGTPHAGVAKKQRWFRDVTFRQAVSAAIDRDAIVRLVYRGRATPLAGHVTPGNRLWVNTKLSPPMRSTARALELLRKSGFRTTADGLLVDAAGDVVEFSILVSGANATLREAATIIQDDLKEVGMRVHVAPFDFRAMVDRILNTHDYEAGILTFESADPIAELNVWLSSGPQHLWQPRQAKPSTPWEAEVDQLMRAQMSMLDPAARKRAYDRVQEIVAANVPLIFLVAPNVLVGARTGLGNFRPVILDHHLLWNVEELFWSAAAQRTR